MTTELHELVSQTLDLTGADPPALLDPDAPVLSQPETDAIYLIGLVGGKDVGKSSLVNALVGQPITVPTSFGPGTERVIAYAHQIAIESVKRMLPSSSANGGEGVQIISHSIDALKNQVLLDLPDIDSHYADHVRLTRRMLRHMLYPIWVQSVEKYADLLPQQLLAAVAEGNDPANFIFCLNKVDQLSPEQAQELRQDYVGRLARVLKLENPPTVYLISATHPQEFDLPALRQMLDRPRSGESVRQSRSLAQGRQAHSLLDWIDHQQLSERAARLDRLSRDAAEIAAERIALPLLDRAIPAMLDDPAHITAMIEPAVRTRLARWPIVNAIDGLFGPLLALAQKNLSATATGSTDPDVYLDRPGAVSASIQTAFAQLQQLHPELGAMMQDRKLWESMPADLAAVDLRGRLDQTLQNQRQRVRERASGRFAGLFAPWRWLLTIGAVIWFPFAQPILEAILQQSAWRFSRQTALLVVQMLSVAHFLSCVTFLLIWFISLWMMLRWMTQQRIRRIIARMNQGGSDDESSLATQVQLWLDELLDPIDQQKQRVDALVEKTAQLRNQLAG